MHACGRDSKVDVCTASGNCSSIVNCTCVRLYVCTCMYVNMCTYVLYVDVVCVVHMHSYVRCKGYVRKVWLAYYTASCEEVLRMLGVVMQSYCKQSRSTVAKFVLNTMYVRTVSYLGSVLLCSWDVVCVEHVVMYMCAGYSITCVFPHCCRGCCQPKRVSSSSLTLMGSTWERRCTQNSLMHTSIGGPFS